MKVLSLIELSIEVIILVSFIMLIRTLFRKQLKPNIRYLLWLFVGIRILIPLKLEIPVSAPDFMTNIKMFSFAIEERQEDISTSHNFLENHDEEQNLGRSPNADVLHSDTDSDIDNESSNSGLNSDNRFDLNNPATSGVENQVINNETRLQAGKNTSILVTAIHIIWLLGMFGMSTYVLINNLRFYRKLKKERQVIRRLPNGIRLYDMQGYNCLFGVIHPAIYVDQKEFENSNVTNHIICHELQHYKVRDNLWQLFRVACLILQWFNPFAWWAYVMSKRDCELACDYRITRDMNQKEKYAYGQSLLAVVEHSVNKKQQITLATSMGNSKNYMSERVYTIMKSNYKNHIFLVAGIICVILALCAISITVYAHHDEYINLSNEGAPADEEEPLNITIDIQDYYITNIGNPSNLYYIDEEHVLWGCGDNQYGQLGQGFVDSELHTELVKIAENVIHVDYSQSGFMIYLTEDHKLYGVGNGEGGALQEFETFDYSTYHVANPSLHAVSTPVLLMEDVKYARCGREDVACLKNDNSVWSWGMIGVGSEYSWMGEPGNMNFDAEPVKVLEHAVLITGGFFNHAALLEDGSVWTWGYNYAGNCGVQGRNVVAKPTKVAEDVIGVWTGRAVYSTDVQNISAFSGEYRREYDNTVIQKRDGTYLICGANVGTEEKVLPIYYEAVDYSLICTWQFTSYEEACEAYPDLKEFMNLDND